MTWGVQERDPLIDADTRAALIRRGREALGLGLLAAGLALAATLWSYAPADPAWHVATDEPPANWLGRPGASAAHPMMLILGLGAWALPALALAWGLRLLLHCGQQRAASRLVLAPLLPGVGAIFAAAHAPGPGWPQGFGLGGLFGDTALGALLTLSPAGFGVTLNLAALLSGLLLAGLGLFTLGADRAELAAVSRFLRQGLGTALAWGRAGAALLLRGASGGAARLGQVAAARRTDGSRPPRPRLAFLRRQTVPEPELVEPAPPRRDIPPPDPDRISARIRDAIKGRAGATAGLFADAPAAAGPGPSLRARKVQAMPTPKPPSRAARAEAQPGFDFDASGDGYSPPALSLLTAPPDGPRTALSETALEQNARMLETVLDDYGIKGEIVSVRPGPVVTLYELEPAAGLKASRVIGLADDIARSMSALAARVSTVPGRSVIGIELPNDTREKVWLREMLAARDYGDGRQTLPLALGKDIAGAPVVVDLAKMPHLLIAGTTGSGKSVAINTMILSLLYRLPPGQCRLIMVDPKMLELSVYDGIPHLLSPVVTDPKKAVVALKWVVAEMEDRYRKMSKMGVRSIEGYNHRVARALEKGETFARTVQTGFDDATGEPVFETEELVPEKLPFIVVVVDEMADLMMVAGKEIEACIQRLAQMARASGIHIIMATQRPSVDVITGTIKANFPTRISFQVTSKIDSRTILGERGGAEQLLGMGDMLYMAGGGRLTRIHGPFVSDAEVEGVVAWLKQQGAPDYVAAVQAGPEDDTGAIDAVLGLSGNTDGDDALYDQAVAIVARDRKCSTSYIQRKLAIGYNKAARLVDQMEQEGVVSPANHVGKREVLVPEV
jgi:DNA segregation ATPase FtsK/SpoIIIE, S-DNA-T family